MISYNLQDLELTTYNLQRKMNAPNKKDALGKGIRSLLQNIDSDLKSTADTLKPEVVEKKTGINRKFKAFKAGF